VRQDNHHCTVDSSLQLLKLKLACLLFLRFGPFWGYQKWHFGCPNQNSETTFRDPNHPQNPQLDHLGTQIGPRKVIFGYFIEFGHFPIEIPIEVNKITDSGRSGPTTKTKSVPKSVNKMEQLENMLKLKFQLSSK